MKSECWNGGCRLIAAKRIPLTVVGDRAGIDRREGVGVTEPFADPKRE